MEETSGLCGKRTLPPLGTGSRVKRFTQIYADWGYGGLFQGWLVVSKRLDPGSSKLARDDTIFGLSWSVSGLVLVFGLDVYPYSVLLIRVICVICGYY